jgi:acyl carrier protein
MTATEEVITGIWNDVLQIKSVGTKEDFFDLGGTSLALLRILGRVNERFNVSLDGSELVDEPTIARLASCVDAQLQNNHLQLLEKK